MDGKTLTQIVDKVLVEKGVSRTELCEAIGITSAAYSGWKKGSTPRDDKIIAIEKYLGISFSDYEKCDPREDLRDDLRILLHSMLTKLLPTPKSPVFSMGLWFLVRVRVPYGSPTK